MPLVLGLILFSFLKFEKLYLRKTKIISLQERNSAREKRFKEEPLQLTNTSNVYQKSNLSPSILNINQMTLYSETSSNLPNKSPETKKLILKRTYLSTPVTMVVNDNQDSVNDETEIKKTKIL